MTRVLPPDVRIRRATDADVPALDQVAEVAELRPLHVPLVVDGVVDDRFTGPEGVRRATERHAASVGELPRAALRLSAGEPAIPTEVVTV